MRDVDSASGTHTVEPKIGAKLGKIRSLYTGLTFGSLKETDIEHIIARSEAHDSGLCRADLATRRAFARDLLNLMLAAPRLNRHEKKAKDAANWLLPKIRIGAGLLKPWSRSSASMA